MPDPITTTLANVQTSSCTDKALHGHVVIHWIESTALQLAPEAASTLGFISATRAADLSNRGWHGLRASGSAALYRIAGFGGHDPEEGARA